MSHLPGQRIPLRSGRWPTKDDMVGVLRQLRAAAEHRARAGLRGEPDRPGRRMLAGRHIAGRRASARGSSGDRPLSHTRHPAVAGSRPVHRRPGALRGLPQCVAVPRPRRARGGCGQFGRRHRGAIGPGRCPQGLAGGAHPAAPGSPRHRADTIGRLPRVVRARTRAVGRSGDRTAESTSAGRSFALRLRPATARAQGDGGDPRPNSHPRRRAGQRRASRPDRRGCRGHGARDQPGDPRRRHRNRTRRRSSRRPASTPTSTVWSAISVFSTITAIPAAAFPGTLATGCSRSVTAFRPTARCGRSGWRRRRWPLGSRTT